MSLIIVADTHITPGSADEKTFYEMLAKLGESPHDVVFLGDIFDLWIGLPGYEGAPQARFLDWCREQKKFRCIGFIEGNHEFFISETHGDSFSWSTAASSWQDDNGYLFVHGDRINPHDKRYLTFRRLTKNELTKWLLKVLPGGPGICNRLSQALRHTNPEYRQGLPETQIKIYADQMFDDRLKSIFVGHFHATYQHVHAPDQVLYLVPAWFESGQVTLVHTAPTQHPVEFINWEVLV